MEHSFLARNLRHDVVGSPRSEDGALVTLISRPERRNWAVATRSKRGMGITGQTIQEI